MQEDSITLCKYAKNEKIFSCRNAKKLIDTHLCEEYIIHKKSQECEKKRRKQNMSYRYELIVLENGYKVKRFIGNDINELQERFEMWFIKSKYTRENITIYKGELQHAGY